MFRLKGGGGGGFEEGPQAYEFMEKCNYCTSDILMTLVTVIIQGTCCSVPNYPGETRSRPPKSIYIEICQKCVRSMVVKVKPNCLMECYVWPAYLICNILEVKQNWQWVPKSGTGNDDGSE